MIQSPYTNPPDSQMQPDEQFLRVLTCNASGSPLISTLKSPFQNWLIINLESLYQVSPEANAMDAAVLGSFRQMDDFTAISNAEARRLDWDALSNIRLKDFSYASRRLTIRYEVNEEHRRKIYDETKKAMAELWSANPRGLFPSPAQVRETIDSCETVELESDRSKTKSKHKPTSSV
ncbi:uncharacterized protein BDR25DRAFT_130564 [Lindgomyces ingoldianus]|uniref:Uncharacterized protein n=1 Tax=Lindgomyces ingoldianus TaxID=673940 RepID=A0ACB6R1Z1_9PLEO|nr:uncharacterized protein BDR25DRAFT_130564 [Lindgomyces ingoldianus]KAF2473279.1 hypothetical protein BDR25DRAFT_130564 [Lindgomyces ingoldianus]